MKTCLKCNNSFPLHLKIDGKSHNLCNRKYCLTCSPFKSGNNTKLHLPYSGSRKTSYKNLTPEQKKYHNEKYYLYQKQKRIKLRIEFINLLGGKCNNCGYCKNMAALHFHHKDPKKKLFSLDSREIITHPYAIIKKEILKCELLCSNCHIEHHHPTLKISHL